MQMAFFFLRQSARMASPLGRDAFIAMGFDMTTSTTDAEAIAREIGRAVLRVEQVLNPDLETLSRSEKVRTRAIRDATTAILSCLASRREAQEPVAPFAENGYGSRLLREAVTYLNEYVFDFDSGADHEPTEFERFMMEDMLNGLFSHEPFFGIIRNLATPPAPAGEPITLTYTNYRSETAQRTIIPKSIWFGSTEWHPEPQWLLRALDAEKNAERDFALKDFGTAPAGEVERLREALEIIAGERQCLDNLMSNADVARAALNGGRADG